VADTLASANRLMWVLPLVSLCWLRNSSDYAFSGIFGNRGKNPSLASRITAKFSFRCHTMPGNPLTVGVEDRQQDAGAGSRSKRADRCGRVTKGELPRAPRRLRRQIFVGEPDLALGWMTVLERKEIARMRCRSAAKVRAIPAGKAERSSAGEEELTLGNAR